MKTKKSLGQHFLRSEKALDKIVEVGAIDSKDTILEIGPGMGVLTEKILSTGSKLIAVEKDDNLYKLLEDKFQKEILSGQLNLAHDDILNFNPKSYRLKDGGYKLIANIPYNITGAILKKFLETDRQPSKIVLLVQKEVARRIVAGDGKESILSTSVKAYGQPSYIETVKAGSFVPMPKVDSAIITIANISKNFFSDISEKNFFEIIHAGFKSKRKKLSSNLSKIYPKNKIRKIFNKLKLSDNMRAEDLDTDTWGKIVYELYGASGTENAEDTEKPG